MPQNISLDYLKFKSNLKIKSTTKQTEVWDIVRKKYLVLQPEELVRQLVVHWIVHDLGIRPSRLQLERQLKINNKIKRFDIIAYSKDAEPLLLVECKSHNEPINQKVFDQIAIYQKLIKAPYLMITNGIDTYLAWIDDQNQRYLFEKSLDNLKEIL